MNNWQAIGYIFLGIGMVLFVIGIFVGTTLKSNYETQNSLLSSALGSFGASVSNMLSPGQNSVIIFSMLPFIAGAVVCWIVSVVGAVAGRKQKRAVQSTLS